MSPKAWARYLERGNRYLNWLSSLETPMVEWKAYYARLGIEV